MNDNFDQQRLGNASQVFGSTSDDTALPFKDKYTTEEQKQRDMRRRPKGMLASKTFYFTHALL